MLHIASLPLRFMESSAKLFKVTAAAAIQCLIDWLVDWLVHCRIPSIRIDDSWPLMFPFMSSVPNPWTAIGITLLIKSLGFTKYLMLLLLLLLLLLFSSSKAAIRKWVDSHSGIKRSSWIIVYVPMLTQSMDTYSKIYAKLSSDFCIEKAGDRTVFLLSAALAR